MLASLLLAATTLAALLIPSTALFRFAVQTRNASWPVRIQPAWQTVQLGMLVTLQQSGQQVRFRPGSMILYAGIGSNDVWITQPGVEVGKQWTLVAGIVRDPYRPISNDTSYVEIARAPSPYDETSFRERLAPAVCEDPTSDRSYVISGQELGTNTYLYGVWRTDDGRRWTPLGRAGEYEPRIWSSCIVGNDQSILLTAGLGRPYMARDQQRTDSLNDVWRSTDFGVSWSRQTAAASWPARFETLIFAMRTPLTPRSDVMYVVGGATPNYLAGTGDSDIYYNDVWASSDYGSSWTLVCSAAPWQGRWGHSGVATRDGAIVFFGGAVKDDLYEAPYNWAFYGDIWASLDGGYTWKECTARTVPYNRTEAAIALDHDGHLLMAAGYSIREPRPALQIPTLQWHNDVIRSTFSLERAADGSFDGGRQLADACGLAYPTSGVIGLQQWPAQRWNANGGIVAGIVSVILFVLVCVFGYMYTKASVARHGQFKWPTATDIKHHVVTSAQMPDVRFLTDLPLADQYREQETAEGQAPASGAAPSNDLGESLLAEGQRSEGSSA